jgi:hypothetical protein
MPEISKTARASMGKQTKEVHVETPEEAIRQLRLNREAGLHIGDMSRVDALLKAYDTEKEVVKVLHAEITKLKSTLKLADVWNAGKQQVIDDAVNSAAKELMATIPAQEEDPEHMRDFEHGGEK